MFDVRAQAPSEGHGKGQLRHWTGQWQMHDVLSGPTAPFPSASVLAITVPRTPSLSAPPTGIPSDVFSMCSAEATSLPVSGFAFFCVTRGVTWLLGVDDGIAGGADGGMATARPIVASMNNHKPFITPGDLRASVELEIMVRSTLIKQKITMKLVVSI